MVGVLSGATLALIALPLFFFAQAVEPSRGVLVGRWHRRGGALPREETGLLGG